MTLPLDFINRAQGAAPLAASLIADIDDAGGYYGYLTMNGAWVIKKVAATSVRYAFGAGDYSANWTNRASLSYSLPDGEV